MSKLILAISNNLINLIQSYQCLTPTQSWRLAKVVAVSPRVLLLAWGRPDRSLLDGLHGLVLGVERHCKVLLFLAAAGPCVPFLRCRACLDLVRCQYRLGRGGNVLVPLHVEIFVNLNTC